MIIARPVPILQDNYAWLLRDSASGAIAIVDPAEPEPIAAAIDSLAGGRLDLILLTHHHGDHIAGTDTIRTRFGARVAGARADAYRLPRLDIALDDGDSLPFGDVGGLVIATPGHTHGQIAYYFADGGVLICGDTLFSLGCGRLLEGSAAEMFGSLRRLAALPADTLVCCGHEYTESNARFALHADPDNAALRTYVDHVHALRAAGQPSVPSRMSDERAANPFLRAPDVASFAALRASKDRF